MQERNAFPFSGIFPMSCDFFRKIVGIQNIFMFRSSFFKFFYNLYEFFVIFFVIFCNFFVIFKKKICKSFL